jgi:hypothetical protein
MLLRCWELRAHIKAFILYLKTPDNAIADDLQYNALTDGLTEQDWDDVKELIDFLKAPFDTTKRLEGNNSGNFGRRSLICKLCGLFTAKRESAHTANIWLLLSSSVSRSLAATLMMTATKIGKDNEKSDWSNLRNRAIFYSDDYLLEIKNDTINLAEDNKVSIGGTNVTNTGRRFSCQSGS